MSSFSVDNLLYPLKYFVTPEILRGASLVLFATFLFIGIVYLMLVISFDKIRNKSSKWCLYAFEFYFLIDLGIALAECTFFSVYYTSFFGCYLFSLIKFMLLTALYALILFEKWSMNRALIKGNGVIEESENTHNFNGQIVGGQDESGYISCRDDSYFFKDKEIENLYKLNKNIKNADKKDLIEEICPLKEDNSSCEILSEMFKNSECTDFCDINIAYLTAVINSLCAKNITGEERSFLSDLKFNLNFSVYKGSDAQKKLNEDFSFLIKKMAEYNVLL